MKKLLIILLYLPTICSSQINPINFEVQGPGNTWAWTVFENDNNPTLDIITNPNTNILNPSLLVAKFTAKVLGQPWAGFESLHGSGIGSFMLDSSNCIVKILVYKNKISDVGIKFVDPTSAAQPEIKVSNSKINEWEELTFDFCSRIGVFPLIKDQIVIFPDFDLNGRIEDEIIYLDNITFSALNGNNSNSWDCINNTCVELSNSNGNYSDSLSCISYCFVNNIDEDYQTKKKILKVKDLLGKKTKLTTQPHFYIYDDGTVEKKIIMDY